MPEDVVKALECCSNENNCVECPCRDKRHEFDSSCAEELMRLAAETIKSLTAEIERLNIRNKTLSAITRNYDWKFSKVKVEAYKEFAERLKAKGTPVTGGKGFEDVYVMCSNLVIDNLVKELTEHKETTVSMIDGHIEE
jgi:predicted RNase H-like nuclease (RuvC/YqgF family)